MLHLATSGDEEDDTDWDEALEGDEVGPDDGSNEDVEGDEGEEEVRWSDEEGSIDPV